MVPAMIDSDCTANLVDLMNLIGVRLLHSAKAMQHEPWPKHLVWGWSEVLV